MLLDKRDEYLPAELSAFTTMCNFYPVPTHEAMFNQPFRCYSIRRRLSASIPILWVITYGQRHSAEGQRLTVMLNRWRTIRHPHHQLLLCWLVQSLFTRLTKLSSSSSSSGSLVAAWSSVKETRPINNVRMAV